MFRHKESKITSRARIDNSLESWKDWELECDGFPASVFLLSKAQPPVSNVLTAEGKSLPGLVGSARAPSSRRSCTR